MFRISAKAEITVEIVKKFIELHTADLTRLEKMDKYYKGEHIICNRTKDADLANNKLVCNHAKYITDTAVGYLIGNPIAYKSKSDTEIKNLDEWLDLSDSNTQDIDLALMVSKFGKACELVYMSNDESPTPMLASIDPRNAFVVYDDTVQANPVFAVYYFPIYNEKCEKNGYKGTVYTIKEITPFKTINGVITFDIAKTNMFGIIPLIEYWNNGDRQSDFEQVISLIDAYNTLQSDRVNDKQQFVEAILALYGTTLGDTPGEKRETYQQIKEFKILELSGEAKAEYIQKAFDEASVELLRKSIQNDIHMFSGVPNMADTNFAGNASGVAMKYKLLGFEQVTKIKERYFKEGLKYRLKLFSAMLEIKGKGIIDTNDIEITFTRSLPSNETEIANMIAQLDGIVSNKTLISQLPFVEDAQAEVDTVKAEKAENIQAQNAMFANTKPNEEVNIDEQNNN